MTKFTPQQIQDDLTAIRRAYTELLKRPADPSGEANYLFGMLNGMTEAQLRANIQTSDEYKKLQQQPPPPPVDPVPSKHLSPLTANGTALMRDGRIYKYRGVTAFTLLQRLLAGQDITPFIRWTLDQGATALRVFGEWGVTNFSTKTANYYAGLAQLAGTLEGYGLDLHFVAFTSQGGGNLAMSPSAQDQHFAKVASTLQLRPNIILEYNNEDWQNGQIAHRFPKVQGILCTRSAFQDGKAPTQAGSLLDLTTEHTPRSGEWERRAKNGLETARLGLGDIAPKTNKPPILGEPIGIASQDVSGRRASDPRKFADYFATAELYTAGACLHGDLADLQDCKIPQGRALECANAVKAVWSAGIPVDAASTGQYTRVGLNGCPVKDNGALRLYAMNQGSRSTVVVVTGDVNPQPADHWRVEGHAGPHGQILRMAK